MGHGADQDSHFVNETLSAPPWSKIAWVKIEHAALAQHVYGMDSGDAKDRLAICHVSDGKEEISQNIAEGTSDFVFPRCPRQQQPFVRAQPEGSQRTVL